MLTTDLLEYSSSSFATAKWAAVSLETNKILCETSLIADQVEDYPIFGILDYNIRLKSVAERAARTVCNMILTQKRAVFILDRSDLQAAYKDDPNHVWDDKGPKTFGNSGVYGEVIRWLCGQIKCCKQIHEGKGKGSYSVYEVTDPIILDWLEERGVDIDWQRTECLAFAKKNKAALPEETKRDEPADLTEAYKNAEPKTSAPNPTPEPKTEACAKPWFTCTYDMKVAANGVRDCLEEFYKTDPKVKGYLDNFHASWFEGFDSFTAFERKQLERDKADGTSNGAKLSNITLNFLTNKLPLLKSHPKYAALRDKELSRC